MATSIYSEAWLPALCSFFGLELGLQLELGLELGLGLGLVETANLLAKEKMQKVCHSFH